MSNLVKGNKKPMDSILAFGDSNTWGLIPCSKPIKRYPREVRWTGLLQKNMKDVRILEEGLCGRTTIFEDSLRPGRKGVSSLPMILASHQPINAAILMLGTNDCKSVYAASEYTIGKGIELCLDELEKYIPAGYILLISPIYLGDDVWRAQKDPEFAEKSVNISHKLKSVYSRIAEERGTLFLAASDYTNADVRDDEHLNEEGHRAIAEAVYEKLKELKAA